MKTAKRFLASALALVLLFQCSPMAYADNSAPRTETRDGVEYVYNADGTVTARLRSTQEAVTLSEPLEQTAAPSGTSDAHYAPKYIHTPRRAAETPDASAQPSADQDLSADTGSDEGTTPTENPAPSQSPVNPDPVSHDLETPEGDDENPTPGDGNPDDENEGGDPEDPGTPPEEEDEDPATPTPIPTPAEPSPTPTPAVDEKDDEDDSDKDLEPGRRYAMLFAPNFPESVFSLGDGAVIHSVTLQVYMDGSAAAPIFTIHPITEGWSPAGLSWHSLPSFGELLQSKNHPAASWVVWDVTAAAASWFTAEGRANAHGLLILTEPLEGDFGGAGDAYYTVTYTPLEQQTAEKLNVQTHAHPNGGEQSTGHIELRWEAIEGAEGYAVGLFDGQDYVYFELGKATDWSTENKGLWPSIEEVEDGRIPIRRDGSGLELPLDPAPYYAAAGVQTEDACAYHLRVVPIGKGGQMPELAAEISVSFEVEHADDGEEASLSDAVQVPLDVQVATSKMKSGFALRGVGACKGGDHNWDPHRYAPPTCTSKGKEVLQCQTCGQLDEKTIPALGHDTYISESVAATCTRKEWAKYKCRRSGCKYEYEWEGGFRAHYYVTSGYAQKTLYQHERKTACQYCGEPGTSTYENHKDSNKDRKCDSCQQKLYLDPVGINRNLQIGKASGGVNSRTGVLSLSWDAMPGANRYYVAIFNGTLYQYIDVGNVTSWSSAGAGIWPTEEEIDNGRYELHRKGGGAELSMIPAFAYINANDGHENDPYYYVCIIPADDLGHVEQPPAGVPKAVRLPDSMPPSEASSLSLEPSAYTGADSVQLTWSGIKDYNAIDATAVTSLGSGNIQYRLDDSETWQNTGINTGSGSYTLNIKDLEEGTHAVHFRAVDGADSDANYSEPQGVSLYVDRTPPTAPSLGIDPNGWNRFNTVDLSWSGIIDMFELQRVEYAFDEGDFTTTNSAEKKTEKARPLDLSALADGIHTLRVRAVDRAGHVGEESTVEIWRDATLPTVTSVELPDGEWTRASEVSVRWTGLEDATSGVKEVWYSFDDGDRRSLPNETDLETTIDISHLSDGRHTLLLVFEDNAGNRNEHSVDIHRDVNPPTVEMLSPGDGDPVNGVVEIWGRIEDVSLEQWEVTATGADGTEKLLASGDKEMDGLRLAILNCAGYADGETVALRICAWDKAGNKSDVTSAVIVVDKSATPIVGSVTISQPQKLEVIDKPGIEGKYSLQSGQVESEGLLYIDGQYVGDCTGGSFPFEAIRYPEGSVHSISVIARTEDGGVHFSEGLASLVLLSDIFEDNSYLSSHTGVSLGQGAKANGGSGVLVSQAVDPKFNLLAFRIGVTEDVSAGSITYAYSLDGGGSWTEFQPDTDVVLYDQPESITIKAELQGKAVLYGWTLAGTIVSPGLRVQVRLTRPVTALETKNRTVTQALTALEPEPKNARYLRMEREGGQRRSDFTYDARGRAENSKEKIVLRGEDGAGHYSGSGAKTVVLLREDVPGLSLHSSAALKADGKLYAMRMEALYEGKPSFAWSTDGTNWTKFNLSEYVHFNTPAEQVYVRVNAGGKLQAWHVEGVLCGETTVTTRIMLSPEKVSAREYGKDYYANEKLWRYDLSWTDPMAADTTADYTTSYEIYRNGAWIATVTETEYSDEDYVENARYELRTVRSYDGSEHASDRVAATAAVLKKGEQPTGVNYTVEEQKQSEYLDKLYGGDYTFDTEPRIPSGDEIIDRACRGEIDLCSYGLEPINFNTGNFYLNAADGVWAELGRAELRLDRSYNSKAAGEDGPFGAGWASPWSAHLRLYTEGDVVYIGGDGGETAFRLEDDGSYTGGEARQLSLTVSEDGKAYLVRALDGTIQAFTGMGLLKYVEWPDGNRITLERDEDGLLTDFILPSGRVLGVSCDDKGHITSIGTPGGGTLRYAYEGDRLVRFTDVDGSETRYVYDGQGRMTEWYDAEGHRQVKNTYDAEGRVTHQLDAKDNAYKLEYFDDHTLVTDALGKVSEIWFDAQRRTVRTVDAEGAEISYEYDASSNIIAITDARGQTTHYAYDAFGNKIEETAPDGSSYSLQYDQNNNLTKLTDQLGNVTTYVYDAHSRLLRETAPDGGVTAYTYNAAGQVETVTDALGNVTRYRYAGVNVAESTDPLGNVTKYAWDAEGRLLSSTDALGNTTRFGYDKAGNLTEIEFADGSRFAYEYDKLGNLLRETDALGNETQYEYDALGLLVRTVYSDGSESRNSYDAAGNLTETTDALGNVTSYAYDGMGNLLTATDALGNVTQYTYDAKGNRTGQVLPNGGELRVSYDALGRISNSLSPLGEMTSYSYDAAGRVSSVTGPDNASTRYSYDSMGRLVKETGPNGAETVYAYDLAGNLVSRTDALGNVTEYAYDAAGNLLTITDALGGVTAYAYDALNRPVSMTDANGAETAYAYDAVGNLVSVTDALGNETKYAYDDNGSVTALTDALGGKTGMRYDELGNVTAVLQKNKGTVTAEYDPLGKLLKETDPLGNETSYEYDALGRVTKITDALGQEAELGYDALGNVERIGSPDGSGTRYAYDLAGRLVEETSSAGLKTTHAYDAAGRLAKTTVNGNETAYAYDLAGNLVSITDAEGRRLALDYDALGNLLLIRYPDGSTDSYTYDALSRLVQYTPRLGEATTYAYNAMGDVLSVTTGKQTTQYEYDALGRVTATITADGARTEASYDALGRPVTATDALGNTTRYGYTAESLLESVTLANGAKLRAKYDLAGNLIAETDPEGSETTYTYDPVGRMTAVTDALGNTTRYVYDAADNLSKVIDALGHETAYTYDASGNLTSETDALGNTVKYSYTPEGWLATVTDAEGQVTRYTYDRTGNILTTDYAGEQTETNTYNELGLLTTVTTAEGVTEYQYDQASRLISVKQPNGETVSYTYDGRGNRSSMTYPNGKTVTYTYDSMDRMTSVKGVDGVTTKYSYDALGRRTATTGGKVDTKYAYDEVGNLVAQTSTGAYDLALSYAYDKSGRMTQESRTEQGTTFESSYVYDALGQLTAFTRSDGLSESYAYDAAGNMTAKTANGVKTAMTYNAANQLVRSVSAGETTRYSYDANGNLLKAENAGGARSYAYNALGLLSQFTREDGYSESYTYNANRLLSGIANDTGTTSFTYDILYGEGVVIGESCNGKTTSYSYGLDRVSAITGSTRTEYIYDGRGSVAAEVSYNKAWYTFGGGLARKNVTSKSYTPFGEQLGEAATGFGYNGEYYNAATGMVYLRARFYEPELNRFSQKDLLRGEVIQPGSLNRYLYVQNDPVNFIDPSGMLLDHGSGGGGRISTSVKTTPKANTAVKVAATVGAAVGGAVGGVIGGAVGKAIGATVGAVAATSVAAATTAVSNAFAKAAANGVAGSYVQSYIQQKTQAANAARAKIENIIHSMFSCEGVARTAGALIAGGIKAATTPTPTKPNSGPDIPNIKALGAGDYGSDTKGALLMASGIELFIGGGMLVLGTGGIGATVLIGMGAMSAIGGLYNEYKGGSFEAGWLGGEAGGAITGFGLGAAGEISKVLLTTGVSATEAVSALIKSAARAGTGGTLGGYIQSIITQRIDTGSIDHAEAARSAVINGTVAALTAGLSPVPAAIETTAPVVTVAISTIIEIIADIASSVSTN